jgi:fermentation-respiration switch protein FrsA (DUF1100 family)
MLRLLAVAALLVLAWWAFLFSVQRRLLFPAPPVSTAPPRPADAQVVWLESEAGRTEAWLLPPIASARTPAPVLLFAHGNAELIDYLPSEFDAPRRRGMAVLLVEYPGYGRSGGAPSERAVRAAMTAAFDWIAAQPALDPARIVAHGRSLGGGAVGSLLERRTPAALVLESTFADTRRFAAGYGAPGLFVRDPFDNVAALRAWKGPVLVLHGERDDIVPVAHGEELAQTAGVPLLRVACGHNDCPPAWEVIEAFLLERGVL